MSRFPLPVRRVLAQGGCSLATAEPRIREAVLDVRARVRLGEVVDG